MTFDQKFLLMGCAALVALPVLSYSSSTCLCGEAPERANDFFWENDVVGFRAYGPGDVHKWSGIDVFNKNCASNLVVHWLREPGCHGNWHLNCGGLGMDDYAVGPGRGVGGVSLRKDGQWLADYGNWTAYRVLTNCDARCAFELDYKLPIGGTMTLAISLEKGSALFREAVSFSPDTPLDGVEVGVGLDLNPARRHVGDVFVDEKRGIVSLFEKPHVDRDGKPVPGEEGLTMSAIRAVSGYATLADEPNGGKMLLTKPLKASDANGRSVLVVLAGAEWSETGRHPDAAAWHRSVAAPRAADIVIYAGEPKVWTKESLAFSGPWDLSNNGTIAIELENTSPEYEVRLCVDLTGQGASRCRTLMIPAGFKGTVDVDVCPKIAHPEVAARLKLMRTTPFMGGDRDKTYDAANVPSVTIAHHWSGASNGPNELVPQVIVRKVVAKDTSVRDWPAWYGMTAEEFFPFVDRYGQFRYRDWPRKVKSDDDLKTAVREETVDLAAHLSPAGWNEYGGWEKGPQLKATGRFRVEKIDGKWWFVDPKGRLWWSHGVVRVLPSSAVTPLDGREDYFADLPKDDASDPFGAFYHTYDELLKPYYEKRGWKRTYDFSAANLMRKYGSDWRATFADLSHRRLRSWGLNTIANSSDGDIRRMNRTPWIERLETRGPKCNEQQGDGWWHVPDPYHPEFRRYLRELLESRRAELTSPWCAGIFVDNEHSWCGISDKTVREYFKVIREEIKRLDPNLLYFGCRFAGSTESIVRICSEYSDVVSYNVYRFRLDQLKLPKGVDKPILIGEFHFGSTDDTGLFNPSLVQVAGQKKRAEAYVRYLDDALAHPNVVGTHWHQFSDQPLTGRFDGENFNVGFTDVCDIPYPEMRTALRDVGATLYERRLGTALKECACK